MEDLLGLFADLLPDSIVQALGDAMPGWLKHLILTGVLAYAGYVLWSFLR